MYGSWSSLTYWILWWWVYWGSLNPTFLAFAHSISDIYLMDFFDIFLVMLSSSYKNFESHFPALDKVSGLLLCSLWTFLWLMYILLTYERTYTCIDTQVLTIFFSHLGYSYISVLKCHCNVIFTDLFDPLGYGQLSDDVQGYLWFNRISRNYFFRLNKKKFIYIFKCRNISFMWLNMLKKCTNAPMVSCAYRKRNNQNAPLLRFKKSYFFSWFMTSLHNVTRFWIW